MSELLLSFLFYCLDHAHAKERAIDTLDCDAGLDVSSPDVRVFQRLLTRHHASLSRFSLSFTSASLSDEAEKGLCLAAALLSPPHTALRLRNYGQMHVDGVAHFLRENGFAVDCLGSWLVSPSLIVFFSV